MFPRNENRNEDTFACSPGTKTGTGACSPKPPFYEPPFYLPMIRGVSILGIRKKSGFGGCALVPVFGVRRSVSRTLVPFFGVCRSVFCALVPVSKDLSFRFLYPRSGLGAPPTRP